MTSRFDSRRFGEFGGFGGFASPGPMKVSVHPAPQADSFHASKSGNPPNPPNPPKLLKPGPGGQPRSETGVAT